MAEINNHLSKIQVSLFPRKFLCDEKLGSYINHFLMFLWLMFFSILLYFRVYVVLKNTPLCFVWGVFTLHLHFLLTLQCPGQISHLPPNLLPSIYLITTISLEQLLTPSFNLRYTWFCSAFLPLDNNQLESLCKPDLCATQTFLLGMPKSSSSI